MPYRRLVRINFAILCWSPLRRSRDWTLGRRRPLRVSLWRRSNLCRNWEWHRPPPIQFVGRQDVMIAMITRLTEGIYMDVNSNNLRHPRKIIIMRTFTFFWTSEGAVYTTNVHSREDLNVNQQPFTCASRLVMIPQHDLTTPACAQHITVKGLLRDVVSADGENTRMRPQTQRSSI